MRALLAAFLCAAVLGCGVPGGEIRKRVAETTLSSGWRVDCTYDHHLDSRRCFAGTFGKSASGARTAPFQLVTINNANPHIMAGHHTFPGRTAVVRVDNNAPLPATSYSALLPQLLNGKTAYVTYHVWPTGPERVTVNLEGIQEAYQILQQKSAEPPS